MADQIFGAGSSLPINVNPEIDQTADIGGGAAPAAPTPPQGIAGTQDGVELFTSNAFTDLVTTASETPTQPAADPTMPSFKTGEFIEYGTPVSGSASSVLQGILQEGSGQVNWDAVMLTKQEELKNTPDWNSIIQKLNDLSPEDRAQTLAELSKEGDIPVLMGKLNTPEAREKFGELMGRLAFDMPNQPKLQGVMSQILGIMNDGKGDYADVLRSFLMKGGFPGKEELGNLSSSQAESLINALNSDQAPDHRLTDLLLMKEVRQAHPLGPFANWGGFGSEHKMEASEIDQQINGFMNDYINGRVTVPPPGMSEALEGFTSDWTNTTLIQFSKNGQLDPFISQMLKSGENPANTLIFLSDSTDPEAADTLRQSLQVLLNKGGTQADDIVRQMAGYMSDRLKDLPPSTLIEMKLILQSGDDTAADQSMITDLIDPAFEIAKNQ